MKFKTPPSTPSKCMSSPSRIPRLSSTPLKLYKTVFPTHQQKVEYCNFCGIQQKNVDYRRKLVSCGIKTDHYHVLEKFWGRPFELITEMVCRSCLNKISATNEKVKKLNEVSAKGQKVLRESFGKNVSKRLNVNSPVKRQKKKSRLSDKENIPVDEDLGVAPLRDDEPVIKVLSFTERATQTKQPLLKNAHAQSDPALPADNFNILVSIHEQIDI